MGRETTAERTWREIGCTSILGNKNEFPFIFQSLSTLAAGLVLGTAWNQEKFVTLFLLSKNTVWLAGQRSCCEFGV